MPFFVFGIGLNLSVAKFSIKHRFLAFDLGVQSIGLLRKRMASVSNTVLREDHPVPAPAGESVTTATVNAGHPAEILEVETEQETDLPLDGGKTAWLVLAATSLIQVPVWGISHRIS